MFIALQEDRMTRSVESDRLGRPTIDDTERLGHYIGITVNRSTRERLEQEAKNAGYRSLSAYIRERKLAEALVARSA